MTTNLITAIVTAYIATGHPCANGCMPQANHTIAAPRSIPLGSIVTIGGHPFIVEDRTNKRFDGRFDIFMSSKQAALAWGKRTLQVEVIQKSAY